MEPGLARTWPPFNFLAVNTPEQGADVVAGFSIIQGLAEHFHTVYRLAGSVHEPDDFHFVPNLNGAAFDTAGDDGAAAGDGKTSSMGIRKGLSTARSGSGMLVYGADKLHNLFAPLAVGIFQGLEGRAPDDGNFIAGELVLC